ncbi:MAG: inorganic phosphate transporter [Bacteroidota bacterium]|nr:inorganic phosphate transporter [Bacteroidota bacterium]
MDFYLIVVIVLFALAITDLIVGVSNDAVNFLNSAIGAKAANLNTLMMLTAVGIIIGAVFSGGMMEIARKGIFHPEHFYFDEIMFIFLAVMLTDIMLLDTFNSLGLPTSTTVSIVFELLGAAVGMSLIKINTNPDSLSLAEYINTSKAFAIVMGILLSVVVAFSIGAIVQYLSRLLFSFRYKSRMKYFGSLFGGIAITAITYFMLIKGVKSASFMTEDVKVWITNHSMLIIGASFAFWTIVIQILYALFKINILRLVVLVGTMALAMAFASNDLVNFIGVPLAGFDSYVHFTNSGAEDASSFLMTRLSQPVKAKTYMLVIAGIIMAITLWLSKKARNVVKTSVNLSRQDEGEERFGASGVARMLVGGSIKLSKFNHKILPPKWQIKIRKQFEPDPETEKLAPDQKPAFDMLRASVNLLVASILIAIGTSLKLPLSTTYVTFMVAMGTSLSDRAWGRESAVYRITGVLSVIAGWFITAFSAFTVAFIVVVILHFGGFVAVIIISLLAAYLIYKTFRKQKVKDTEAAKKAAIYKGERTFVEICRDNVSFTLSDMLDTYKVNMRALMAYDRKTLKKNTKRIEKISKESKNLKDELYKTIQKLDEEEVSSSLHYVQVLDYLREASHSLSYIGEPSLIHVENKHKELSKAQIEDLEKLVQAYRPIHEAARDMIMKEQFDAVDYVKEQLDYLTDVIAKLKKDQLKRIKKKKDSTKASVLFINLLQENKLLAISVVNLLKSYRDFRQLQ